MTDLTPASRGVRVRVRELLVDAGAHERVAAYQWDGDARPDLLVSRFTPRLAALVE